MLVSTEIISMDDNATVLDLFYDPKYMEDNLVNRTITVIVDEGSPSTELHQQKIQNQQNQLTSLTLKLTLLC